MTVRSTLRNLGYVLAEFIPFQAVTAARGRDYEQAVNRAADALNDYEAEHELLMPPAEVAASSPFAPSVGLNDWQLEQLKQHARRWCDLPTVQPGPLPVPDDHPDHQ